MDNPVPSISKRTAALLLGVGIFFVVTWLMPVTRPAWDSIDRAVFHALNGWLGGGGITDRYWEFSNTRVFDKIMFLGYGVLCLGWIVIGKIGTRRRRLFQVVTAMLGIVMVRVGVEFIMDHFDYARRSPSIVIKTATKLNSIFPDTKAKFASTGSFPGDHALVSMWMMIFFVAMTQTRFAVTSVIMTMIAATPRLVVGAHWFTDNIVGGLGFSLIGFGLLLVSGLYALGVTLLENCSMIVEKRLGIKFLGDAQAEDAPAPDAEERPVQA